MSEPQGMLALEDLTRLVASGEIDTVVVAFTDVYGRLVGKRFDASFFLDSAVEEGAGRSHGLVAPSVFRT